MSARRAKDPLVYVEEGILRLAFGETQNDRKEYMIQNIKGMTPKVDPSAFVADNATVVGNVAIGRDSSIWFGAVVRGDSNSVQVGTRTNIQDLCVLHVDNHNPLFVGDDVTVGHRAILHGCRIGNRVIVGMGSIIMNGVEVGDDSIVGAGALITEGTKVPPHSLVLGIPAKVRRELTEGEVTAIRTSAEHYVEYAERYRNSGCTPHPAPLPSGERGG